MSYYGFTLQELRDLMELRGEEALVKERWFDEAENDIQILYRYFHYILNANQCQLPTVMSSCSISCRY